MEHGRNGNMVRIETMGDRNSNKGLNSIGEQM
jgi:hypothetical protein